MLDNKALHWFEVVQRWPDYKNTTRSSY